MVVLNTFIVLSESSVYLRRVSEKWPHGACLKNIVVLMPNGIASWGAR